MSSDGTTATSTLEGARDHARSLAGVTATTGPTVPSAAAGEGVIWDEVIGAGGYAFRMLPRGGVVRITDVEGDGCVQLLAYNALLTSERLNVADTVKVQWQAYLGPGALLLSDMGRVLLTLVADTSGRHDCLGGCSNRNSNAAKYGDGTASGPTPNARDLLALAAGKHGLARHDIGPNLNLFKGVRVDDDGALHFEGDPKPDAYVELRAELPVLLVVANTPHPLDPRLTYDASPVRFTAWRPGVVATDDSVRTSSPERARAFENTDEFLLGTNP